MSYTELDACVPVRLTTIPKILFFTNAFKLLRFTVSCERVAFSLCNLE